MNSSEVEFPTRTAMITVSQNRIQIRNNYMDSIKRHYQYRPIITIFVCSCIIAAFIMISVSIIFDPEWLGRVTGTVMASVFLVYFALLFVLSKFRTDVTTESQIPASAVDYITWRSGGLIRGPKFVIVYDNEEHKRQIWCVHPPFGGKNQLEQGLDAFRQYNYPLQEK